MTPFERKQLETLERIADATQAIAGAMIIDKAPADSKRSSLCQLLGSTMGFTDELDDILQESDAFKRANRLRDLVKRGNSIAESYRRQLAELELADGEEEETVVVAVQKAEAGQRQEV